MLRNVLTSGLTTLFLQFSWFLSPILASLSSSVQRPHRPSLFAAFSTLLHVYSSVSTAPSPKWQSAFSIPIRRQLGKVHTIFGFTSDKYRFRSNSCYFICSGHLLIFVHHHPIPFLLATTSQFFFGELHPQHYIPALEATPITKHLTLARAEFLSLELDSGVEWSKSDFKWFT